MSILYFRNSDGKFIQIPSIPGKSAYEIAVEKGVFQGTEEEFARHQIFENKDILDQITQENIDLWTEGGNIDLTPYQTIEEDTLITEAKDIPGAINELYDNDIEFDRDGADSIKVFEGYPDLSTEDKTIIGAINELDYRLENISDIIDVQLSGSLSDHIEYQHPLVNTTDDLELINPRKLSDGTLAFVKEEAKYYYYTKADGWQELKTGGTGSGGGATSAYISSTASENLIVATDNDLELPLDFNSPNAGRGILKVFINDVNSANISLAQGETTVTIDSELFKKGDNTLTIYALDRVGAMSNSLTFYVRYGGTEITTDFDSDSSYDYGSVVRFYFVASALDTSQMLSFSMKIDGELHGTISCSSDIRSYYTFPNTLSVGSHRCEAWAESEDGAKSNVLTFNLVILDDTSLVISADGNKATIEEGAQLSLGYKVFMKNNSSFITKTYVDEQLVNTGTCGLAWNYYKTSSLTEGVHSIKVEVWDVTETVSDYVIWIVTVTGSTYEMVQPTTAGAVFLATALNMNNSSETREVWNGINQDNQVISANLYNFAFNSESGWIDDELLITGNSYVELPITPLSENAKYGFTLDIEFRTKPIGVENAEVLRLWNDEDNCGILITTDSLLLQSKDGNKCDLYFTEDEIVSAIFIIDRNECTAKIYLNGVMCEAFHLSDYVIEGEKFLEDFTVNNHVIIGGKDKNGYSAIRNLRIYEVALATNEILNNFISNEKNKEKQKALVEFQKGNDLPTLTIYGDFSGLGKDDKKPCDIVYVSPDTNKYGESFTLSGKYSQLQYQGTSSMQYPIKNYRINPRDKNGKKKINPFNGGKPESRFTLKADFMTSNHAHNTGMAKFISDKLYNYNNNDEKTMNPMRWHLLQNGEDVNSVRETINGFPCRLILVNDGESALNEGQAEPTPGNTKDMGIFNFNNDKDNLNTMGMDTDIFPNCISYEVTANSDTSAGAFVPFSEPITIKVKSSYIPISLIGAVGDDVIVTNSTNNFEYWCSMCDKDKKRLNWNNQFPKTITSDTVYFEVTWDNNERKVKTSTGRTILFILDTELNEEYLVITDGELSYLQNSFELRYPDADDVGKDYGYLGMMDTVPIKYFDFFINPQHKNCTTAFDVSILNTKTIVINSEYVEFCECHAEDKSHLRTITVTNGVSFNIQDDVKYIYIKFKPWTTFTEFQMNEEIYRYGNVLDGTNLIYKEPYIINEYEMSQDYGLKRVIDWVGNCTDEEFVADFEKYFNRHYTLRYYLLVVLIGAVDNLGKNLMLDTWDGQIWYPRFYDIDTILSYDNSGAIKFDVDIEMEQGYWNTSSSRLWTRVRDLFHDELIEVYKDMRGNGVTYEGIMKYMYDEQIAKIPQTYYNKDFDIKYAPYADEYLGKAHGDGYQHMKRWLKNRFIFCDTLFDYAPSYENDKLTIRANTLDLMSLEIETYTPVYQHISFYNGQMSKEKVDGKTSTIFEGTAQTATDQEVLIYGGSNIKKISGISSMNPDSMLIGNATRLTELIATDCPLLTEINSDKANLLPNVYLNKVDLSGCTLLGGMLKISNSQLLQNLNMKGTAITGVQLPSSIRNLEVLRLPNTIKNLTLNDAPLLHTLEFDNGINLQSISLKNCNRLDNCINFDLTQTPSVLLDNSYNADELYMSATTDLTLKNMPSLKRVIFTPNSEYSEFDINNVINGKNYKITTFNNPMMTDFITTAPHRLSYNGDDVEWVDKEVGQHIESHNVVKWMTDFAPNGEKFSYDISGRVNFNNKEAIIAEIDLSTCSDTSSGGENILSIGHSVTSWSNPSACHCYYRCSTKEIRIDYRGYVYGNLTLEDDTKVVVVLCSDGIFINDNLILTGSQLETVLSQEYLYVASSEGSTRSYATYQYIGKCEYEIVSETIQVKDYGDITPNTAFTANTLDLADTQFQNVKFLCTTDIYNLKAPTTMKNFYCDSAFDIDTDVIEDASYEVIHEELIEPYTTNYEGEVYIYEEVTEVVVWNTTDNYNYTSNKIYVSPNTSYTLADGDNNSWVGIHGYDTSDTKIWGLGGGSTDDKTAYNGTFGEGVSYVIITCIGGNAMNITYQQPYTPNIIPSSANGSLIFNMYSNNTTQPTSTSPYMWDLTGLKLEDFYTYGMNNWVKASEDSYRLVDTTPRYKINDCRYTGADSTRVLFNNFANEVAISPILLPSGTTSIRITTSNSCNIAYFWSNDYNSTTDSFTTTGWSNLMKASGTSWSVTEEKRVALISFASCPEWFDLTLNNETTIRYHLNDIEVISGAKYNSDFSYANFPQMKHSSIMMMHKFNGATSITMPQRMPGYSVRLVNADITPDEYPTMLYPKLIDTMLPITGKLDYTKYNGTSLAWAYAYTTNDVNINPLDSRSQVNITQDYNKLYSTDFVDIVDVWIYKDTDVNKFSSNDKITKAYIELTQDNYKTRIDEVLQWYPNCTDVYLFEDGSVTTLNVLFGTYSNVTGNASAKAQIKKITFMDGYFTNVTNTAHAFADCSKFEVIDLTALSACKSNSFQWMFIRCSNLTQIIGIDLLDVSNATDFSCMFYGCGKLTSIDTSKWTVKNGASFAETFKGCSSLTQAPTIPNGVTDMSKCFDGCTSLTTVPNIPQGVTNIENTFNTCTSLTTAPNIPNSVTNMSATFYGCTSLTTVPTIPQGVTNIDSTFQGCTSLTTVPNIPQGVTRMNSTFRDCTSLTTVPTIPNSVNSMYYTFYNCASLTTVPTIPNSVTNMAGAFYRCTSLTQAPNIPSGVTNMSYCFQGCTSLTQAPTIPSSVTNMSYCFQGCTSLVNHLVIPNNCMAIDNVVQNCINLTGITIPLTKMGINPNNGANFPAYYSNAMWNTPKITNVDWVGERNVDLNVTGFGTKIISQADIKELVPEHLGTVTGATLTLGDYASYLSIGEILSAQAKGWTIEGNFSGDYAIVNASTDLSAVEVNSDITTVIVELTNDNYKTRMNEVYTKYPSMTDILFIEDGTVTTLADMFNNSNNNACRSKIKKIEFLEGYFQNLTSLSYSFYNCTALTDISNIPSSVTNMYRTFYYCGALVNVTDLPDGVTNVNYTFYYCDSLVTAPKLGKTATVLDYTFYSCEKLQSIPEFPPSVTKLTGTFSGCTKLQSVPKIPDSVTDMSNCFYNCHALPKAPELPASIQMLSSTFYYCSNMTEFPSIIPKTVINTSSCFYYCSKMVTPPEFEHTDGSNLYAGRMFQNCSNLTSAPKIPNGVDNIQGMFMGCSKLQVPPTIPDSVTNMQETFNNCTGLTQNPNVPTGVTNLKYAFSNSSITAITIPLTNLTTYDYAISKCPNLTDVTWVGELTKTFNVKNLYYKSATDNTTPTATDIQELIPEHLGTVTGQTLTLGDYISHLSEDEISQAVAKGWTIQ